MHPTFLDISLRASLQKLNLETLDCAVLQTPFELRPNTPKYESKQSYLYALASAFEYYESAVQKGLIRCYGFSANESIRLDPADVTKNRHMQQLSESGQLLTDIVPYADFEV